MARDMTSTWILRVFLALIIFMSAALVIVIVDDAAQRATGAPRIVESMVCAYVLLSGVWGWVSRRVWIGTQAPNTHSPKTSAER
jgi:hypothetical protein